MAKSSKGSAFERAISKQLSLWWTNGESDTVFWRSAMSGGRATVRAKVGKSTAYLAGDICAIDPIGAPLVESTVIELKRGYKSWCALDLIDGRTPSKTTLGKFLSQVEEECKQAKVNNYLLICRRDGRASIAIIPIRMMHELNRRHRIDNVLSNGIFVILLLEDLFKVEPAVYLECATSMNRSAK